MKAAPERKASVDPQTAQILEKQLGARPKAQELVDRNILKDDSVAPALQAARDRLERSQLEDKLAQAIQHRPQPEDLVKEGILKPEEIPEVLA